MLGRIFGTGEMKLNVTLRGLCVDSRLCYGDWIKGGNRREGIGELCVENRLC